MATTELINDYTGPVVLFDGAGAVQMANGLAKPIISALAGGPGATLRGMLDDALKGGGVASKRLNLPIPTGDGVFDVTLLPEGAGEGETPSRVLLLARDSTFDVNFGRALVASRQLFKDLVACSADFVWETDADGCFTFVSGRGLLGYTPDELDGRPARDLLADGEDHDASEAALNPFESLAHLDEVECWLLDRDDARTCVRASCLPVFDDDGTLQGVRGVCRDITSDKQRQAALNRAREREQLTRSIVDSIRDALTPEEMFTAAAAATATAMAASHIWILRDDKAGGLHLTADRIARNAPILDIFAEAQGTFSGDPERVHHTVLDGHQILLVPCHFRYQPKGVLAVAMEDTGDTDALEEAVTTLLDIASQLGIAMAQAEIQERLEELSTVDELTGLLNRRGFYESVGKRIAQHQRTGRVGVLLYIDLDYFKSVNDNHGHQAGDAALVAVAEILRGDGDSRQGDIVGRLGGDEFAIWLEETERGGGLHKAEELLEKASGLRKYSGDEDHPLGFSVGIAVVDPDFDDDLDRMIFHADRALYRAKRGGRGQAVLAERDDDELGGSEEKEAQAC
ncbi:MAG: diguanylate cyclase [Rhodospirillaceae bacterium]|nr:diguanylate cyclase [Rhodospirillaceae bacterium]MBT5192126.1 diguanylate cyclase [Rhodospirillaceae bacterium]MBT5896110.1 diguanylate cyclase [Rhodospirillaceae bacterium]MBT6430460.1 diguanylate cyclase [Rhodospirillaceae bacterium]